MLLDSHPKVDLEISRSFNLPHLRFLEAKSNANVLASTPVPVRPSHGRNLGHVMPVLGSSWRQAAFKVAASYVIPLPETPIRVSS